MINEIEVREVLSKKIPSELCDTILSFRPPHDYIKQLKQIKQICFDEEKEDFENDDESTDDMDIDDYGLFQLLFYSKKCNILDFKTTGKLDFDHFYYRVYEEYISIYYDYGYEIEVLDIPDRIIEEYLLRKENNEQWEENYRRMRFYDEGLCAREDFEAIEIPFFKHEFRIPKEQLIKYKQRLDASPWLFDFYD